MRRLLHKILCSIGCHKWLRRTYRNPGGQYGPMIYHVCKHCGQLKPQK